MKLGMVGEVTRILFVWPLRWIRRCFDWDPWQRVAWSQEGEDLILKRIFGNRSSGFYVDVGAHHPKRFSNTYLLYRDGWSGMNIDAMPGSMKAFNRHRPSDINLELGIGRAPGEFDYHVFNEPALNSFSSELSAERDAADSRYQLKEVINVPILPLAEVFDKNLPPEQSIDFMNIDAEGLDFDVLASNDWSRYRPDYVLVEVLGSSMHEVMTSDIGALMSENGYDIYAKCMHTCIFRSNDCDQEPGAMGG